MRNITDNEDIIEWIPSEYIVECACVDYDNLHNGSRCLGVDVVSSIKAWRKGYDDYLKAGQVLVESNKRHFESAKTNFDDLEVATKDLEAAVEAIQGAIFVLPDDLSTSDYYDRINYAKKLLNTYMDTYA